MSFKVWILVAAVVLIPAFILLALQPLSRALAIRRTNREQETPTQFDLDDRGGGEDR